ncbi:MAG: TIGR02444 family protein [Halomonas sp.]|uniref:TIGR02444 family protein n=1 Tax=Halomonas TaxID=2745 RepID=UPI0009FDAC45|nr:MULTISPECIES: TIGR02444 family protein [Halomonas]NWN84097.1 TIGR02444 family protein [Halomonas sp.]
MTADSTQSPYALSIPDALWQYALARYGDPTVADACLELQDRAGADVCELLWLGWLDHLGRVPDADAAAVLAPIRLHQACRTRPLRARRRALKPIARPGSPLEEWRERLKRAELAAERQALARLQAITERGEGVRLWRRQDGDLYTRLYRHLAPFDTALVGSLTALANRLPR